MHPTVKKIREKFPEVGAKQPAAYCVGGALCLWVCSEPYRHCFPTHYELVQVLMFATGLSVGDATSAALSIIASNDQGFIEDAWQALSDAFDAAPDVPLVVESKAVLDPS